MTMLCASKIIWSIKRCGAAIAGGLDAHHRPVRDQLPRAHVGRRGGELCALVGPLGDNGPAGIAGLPSARLLELAVVGDRDDITVKSLTAAVMAFRNATGWADLDRALAAEAAEAMALEAADIAAEYEVGTTLRASFDHRTELWALTPEPA
jgi:hypothetical protein